MAASVDLRELIADRPDDKPPQSSRRRHLVTRYLIPLGVVAGFGTVIAWSAKDNLQSSRPVTVVPVMVARAEAQRSGTPLELKTEETWRVAEAEAGVQVAAARFRQAELAVQAARLRLERMTLRAPLSGRVLALNAQPGRRVTGLTPASEQDSSTVLTLYDPCALQVRADVRLEDVPQVQPGQPVQISCAVLSQPLSGQVLTAISIADIQKNTLQVKVAIDAPPPVMKPDMLVQVIFLAPEKPRSASA
ncbi:MAG: efflux RND transporter periplasmic adaptor subunit [Pirellulaceae bacterium]